MYVPSTVCKQLFRLHPQLRFAWMGRERQNEEDLNAGDFAVVQLYHIKDAGTPDEPNTFYMHWPRGAGPIYNRNGGSTRDWDPLFRMPILVARLGDFGISKEEVLSGAVISQLESWIDWEKNKRVVEHRRKMGRDMVSKFDDLAGEMTDYLWHEGNKASETSINTIPWKDSKKELERSLAKGQQRRHQLEHYYDIPFT